MSTRGPRRWVEFGTAGLWLVAACSVVNAPDDPTEQPAGGHAATGGTGASTGGAGGALGCTSPNECPGSDTTCSQRTCTQGTCGVELAPSGTPCTEDDGEICDDNGHCVAASCADDVQDGDETDVDCGGSTCPPCTAGDSCEDDADCDEHWCNGTVCDTPTCQDLQQNGWETGIDCGGSTCPGCEQTVYPSTVLECGTGFLDEVDHQVGDGYAMAADDLRSGSCAPSACVPNGKTQYGMDLEFTLGLPAGTPLLSAELHIRGIPNGGAAGIITIYDYETDQEMGQCTIDMAAQEYGDCTATLTTTNLEPTTTRLYTLDNNPSCYLVYDFIELRVTY